ncbi:hypothetical protein AZ46_0220335 [Metabacillus indicus LMG 22858]|nr:hypothetical protein AZ46_0220335 [Metabacillus indicus LMG 22858]
MKCKIESLEVVREDIGEKIFRSSLANIIIKHYVEVLEARNLKINRRTMLSIVNFILSAHGASDISYSYVKKLGF